MKKEKYTLEEIADFFNISVENDNLNIIELENIIEDSGFISDCGDPWGVCHSNKEKVVLDDNGIAFVTTI